MAKKAKLLMHDLKQNLTQLIRGEVLDDPATLAAFSRDASLFEVRPELVVRPASVEDVCVLVKYVAKHKKSGMNLSLTARSGGTDMSGGPLNRSIIVDINAHINQLKHVGAGYAVAEPGMFYRDFEKQTLKHGLLMPSYPASRGICTIGGMVANNSGGEKSLVYGQTKDYIKALKVVLADGVEYEVKPLTARELEAKIRERTFEGRLYKQLFDLLVKHRELIAKAKPTTSKNSAGYFLWDIWDGKTFDLTQLICGSQGTLGLITEISFRMIKPKKYASMLVLFLDDFTRLGDMVSDVLRYKPESFESYDEHTFSLAMRYLPQLIASMKGGFFSWAWQFLPEVKLVLTGGLPKLVMIAEFTGDTPGQARLAAAKCKKLMEEKYRARVHLTKNRKERMKYWIMRRESFNLLRKHSRGMHTAPFIDDIIVHPSQLPEFLPLLDKIFAKYKSLIYTVAGHTGDANFHIIPLMKLSDPKQRQIIPKLAVEVYSLVLKFQGSITAEHNDGLIRTPFLEKMYGSQVVELFAQVKDIFDPQNLFNPGKKVGELPKSWQEYIVKD